MTEIYTFNKLIKEILENTKVSMSSEEIWQKTIEFQLDQKIGTTGKTLWPNIGARIYTNIKEYSVRKIFENVLRFALPSKSHVKFK